MAGLLRECIFINDITAKTTKKEADVKKNK